MESIYKKPIQPALFYIIVVSLEIYYRKEEGYLCMWIFLLYFTLYFIKKQSKILSNSEVEL